MKREYFISACVALMVTAAGLGLFMQLDKSNRAIEIRHVAESPSAHALFARNATGDLVPLDFTQIADQVMDAVVHIRSVSTVALTDQQFRYPSLPEPFEHFFRRDPFREYFAPEYDNRGGSPDTKQNEFRRMGQGSGVIITKDGYIVTNYHVVENADELEVVLHDNRTYPATVVGTDPATDLALLQIKEENLPALGFVDSDEVRVGEWVLAVGNPFNLTSTVTAGIVSAKARNINILREKFAVESFIQTDAAINPGNSGGALVNLQGGLIGINTAIASPTGSYSGYGFAVPSNIVTKVVEDLMTYGTVQRGVLGILIRSVDGNLKDQKGLSVNTGAFVDSLLDNSAAAAAGIRVGDVIVAINDAPVKTSPQLQELIARHSPGDKVKVTINRNGQEKSLDVVLNNRSGNTSVVKKEHQKLLSILGADLESLSKDEASKLEVDGGVRVVRLYPGKFKKDTDMQPGFVILKVDGKTVETVDDLVKLLEGKSGGVMLEGVYDKRPGQVYYAFGM